MFKFIINLIIIVIILLSVLLSVAYLTYVDRKLISLYQNRIGPSIWGIKGLIQPVLDAIKLLLSEYISTTTAVSNKWFIFFPYYSFMVTLLLLGITPMGKNLIFYSLQNYGLIYMIIILELELIGALFIGLTVRNKFALIGSLRVIAQKISFTIVFSLILINIAVIVGSFNINTIVLYQYWNMWLIFPLLPSCFLFYIIMIAESSRIPFDNIEAEAEIASGVQIEFSSSGLVFIIIADYARLILLNIIFVNIFLGGWCFNNIYSDTLLNYIIYSFKLGSTLILSVILRLTFPRVRYDQIAIFGWKFYLVLIIFWLSIYLII